MRFFALVWLISIVEISEKDQTTCYPHFSSFTSRFTKSESLMLMTRLIEVWNTFFQKRLCILYSYLVDAQ